MRVTQVLLVAVVCACALAAVQSLTPVSAQATTGADLSAAATGAAAASAAAAGGAKVPAKGKTKVKVPVKGKGKVKGKAVPPPPGKYKGKQKVKVGAAAGASAGAGAAAKKWSPEDFVKGAGGKAHANAKAGGVAKGLSDDGDDEVDEEDISKSWEEETEQETWEEEEDENMPKFITLDRLNDTAKLSKLRRHQLLRIGRSLLRDPQFDDCLLTLVLTLIDTAKASTCSAPDINVLAAAEDPSGQVKQKALEAAAAVAAAAAVQVPVGGAGDSAATDASAQGVASGSSSGASAIDAIIDRETKERAPKSENDDDYELQKTHSSGTNPTGARRIPRNKAGEVRAQAAAEKAQLQGVPVSSTVDPTVGKPETVIGGTPYNPNRVVTYNIIGRSNEFPSAPTTHAPITPQTEVFDVAIVGCGLSGLTAMYRVRNLTVVCLEWSDEPGGIAAQQTKDNITWATGAAYAPVPYAAILDLWHEIGLPKPEEIELGKPRDSFWVDRNLYLGIWEEALDDLPEDWYEFKSLVDALDYAGMIGVPPLEREQRKAKIFDGISAGELIENFGSKLKTMLDLYCRSALGSVCADISAMAFLDFYSDELYERVAFPGGTGAVTKRLVELIKGQDPSRIRTGVWVYDLQHLNDTMVQIRYVDTKAGTEKGYGGSVETGSQHVILARRVIMATPVNIGAKIIKDLSEPQKLAMESVEHMHYLVHNVHTPLSYFHSSYDTWTADVAFTDIIVARWQEATLSNTAVARENSILSVYQPLPRTYWSHALNDSEVRGLSEEMLRDLEKLLPGYKTAESVWIDTHRWPGSINILRPGLSTGSEGATMRANHGRIIFAGSNLGIPSLEEAIERGLIASKELHRLRAIEAANEAHARCDAGKSGITGSCDSVDETLRAQSAEEKEAAEHQRAVDAASGAVASDSTP